MKEKIISKKAIIVGGSNGIGLAIAIQLIHLGYFVEILDMAEPDIVLQKFQDKYKYLYCNLMDFDDNLFEKLADDSSIEILMITAGIGRVADFEFLHIAEIERLIQVNTVAAIKIIRIFYNRIKDKKMFYCGIMGSIAGLISSPMFSVYAASKAAICRFIESVNIELEVKGIKNRILNISPGNIKGTRFDGATVNDLTFTAELANNIVNCLLKHQEIYIPEYDEIYKKVINCYKDNPHLSGLNSYKYKKGSGRAVNCKMAKIGYLSGTFDLFHVGHLNILERAKSCCDYLIVGVHPSAARKGKKTFIPFEERMRIVGAIKYVDKVVPACLEDSDAWDKYKYDVLFVGSDYKGTERFKRYEEYFSDKEVKIIYFPYTQGTSSTQIREIILMKIHNIKYEDRGIK